MLLGTFATLGILLNKPLKNKRENNIELINEGCLFLASHSINIFLNPECKEEFLKYASYFFVIITIVVIIVNISMLMWCLTTSLFPKC